MREKGVLIPEGAGTTHFLPSALATIWHCHMSGMAAVDSHNCLSHWAILSKEAIFQQTWLCSMARESATTQQLLWSRKRHPTPVFLPGKLHGQRCLVGYSPWGCKELDSAKHTVLSRIINMWFWICSLVTSSVFFTSSYSITDSLRWEAQTVLHF